MGYSKCTCNKNKATVNVKLLLAVLELLFSTTATQILFMLQYVK